MSIHNALSMSMIHLYMFEMYTCYFVLAKVIAFVNLIFGLADMPSNPMQQIQVLQTDEQGGFRLTQLSSFVG